MRLQEGTKAPEISGETSTGWRLSAGSLAGRTVLLKFYRFASCPICNLALREYVRRASELSAAGITVVAVFHSAGRKLRKTLRKFDLPFEVVADPGKRLFKAYEVESSMRGMFAGAVWREYAKAMFAGFFTRPFGHEGGVKGHPADFLIDESGTIRFAHYGRDYADTVSVDQILAEASKRGLTRAPARSA